MKVREIYFSLPVLHVLQQVREVQQAGQGNVSLHSWLIKSCCVQKVPSSKLSQRKVSLVASGKNQIQLPSEYQTSKYRIHLNTRQYGYPVTFWHKQAFFSLVFIPPFKFRTIWQLDTNLPFEYQTCPVLKWLLYSGDPNTEAQITKTFELQRRVYQAGHCRIIIHNLDPHWIFMKGWNMVNGLKSLLTHLGSE